MNRHTTSRIISIVVIQSLIVMCAFVFSANAAKNETAAPARPAQLHIPENYGFVKDVYLGSSGKLVLYIEDIHANVEAQKNIERIITHAETFFRDNPLRLIAVEGAQGRIDPSLLKSCPDKRVKEKIAESLLADGYISGAEWYSVLSDRPVLLYGIEQKGLYVRNLKDFIRVQRIKEKGGRYFEQLRKVMNGISQSAYPPEARPLMQMEDGRRTGSVPVSAYAQFLYERYADARRGNPSLQAYYDNLKEFQKFMSAVALEKLIDYKQLPEERESCIAALSAKLDKGGAAELVEKSLLFRTGRMPAAEFYSYLRSLADANKVSFDRWPYFERYIRLVGMYGAIRNDDLFAQTDILADLLKGVLLRTDRQKEAARMMKALGILEKMFSLQLSRQEIEYYAAHRDEFTAQRFKQFMDRYPHEKIEFFDEYLDLIFSAVTYVQEFYDTALARDGALFRNMLRKLKGEENGCAVLITGGFHTAGVRRRLEAEGISYVIVAPRASQAQDNAVYMQRMMEVSPPFARYMFQPSHLAAEVLSAVEPITGRAQKNREYLNAKEILLALSLMLAKNSGGKSLLPEEIRRYIAERQTQWLSQFKKLKSRETADGAIITFADGDADLKRLSESFACITCDHQGVRWIGGSHYLPFNIDINGTKKSAVFVLGRKGAGAQDSTALIEKGSIDKEAAYEIIDEREFSHRIELANARESATARTVAPAAVLPSSAHGVQRPVLPANAGSGKGDGGLSGALAAFSPESLERLYTSVREVSMSAELQRQRRVIDELIAFEKQGSPAASTGDALLSKRVFPRFVSFIRELQGRYPGLCTDVPERVVSEFERE